MLLGGIAWSAGCVASVGYLSWISDQVELPLGNLRGIGIDSKGHVFCGLQFYSRIQQYDAKGEFVNGWFIDSSGGAFRLRINDKDEVEVITARKGLFYLYSAQGELVEATTDKLDLWAEFGEEGELRARQRDGTTLLVRQSIFNPVIVKSSSSGELVTFISTPLSRWFFMGPFPAFSFVVAGIVLLRMQRWLEAHTVKNEP